MNKKVSLNFLLRIINIIIIIVMCVSFIQCGGNHYIDGKSVVLGSMLAIETCYILNYSEKHKNATLLVLGFILTFFYSLRIVTLIYIPFSVVFMRSGRVMASDVNFTLLYIIVSSFFFFIGVRQCSLKQNIGICLTNSDLILYCKPLNVSIVLLFVFLLTFSIGFEIGFFSVIAGYLTSLFLNIFYLLLACWVFVIYYRDRLNHKTNIFFYCLFLLFTLLQVLSGSRSALLTITLILLFGLLSYKSILYLKVKYVLTILLFIPLAIIFFFFSTFIRQSNSIENSVIEKIQLVNEYEFVNLRDLTVLLAPVFDRIGFLDYATEVIVEKEKYSSVLNPLYYLKSVVDNVFSPGFNVFDTPKVSNSFVFIYDDRGPPKLSKMLPESYQSDQITVFGEFYSIFGGCISTLVFFFVGYIFQKIQLKRCRNRFVFYLRNAFVLNALYILINSFGLDWFLFDVLSLLVTFYIFIFSLKLSFGKKSCKP